MRLVRKMQTVMVLVCGAAATSAVAQDFSGDAKSDLVWRNYANGSNLLWRMDNATILGQTAMSAVTDTDWRCVAKGDFNNDGQADIVWRNTRTGSNTIWLMNGSTNVASRPLAARTDRDWRIVGTGDFSTPSDGLPDVLWHNARTGELQAELLNASSVATGTVNISTVSDISWLAVATGDFNGDGFADVLWRNYRTGALLIWNMNNAAVVGTTAITVDTQYANVAWLVSDVTDMNGDDTPDLIWRNALTGEVRVMTMDGAAVMGVQTVSTVSNTSWQICCEDNYAINVRDFDANGTEDIVWRDTVTGSTLVWATSPVIGQVNGAAAIENFGPPTEIQAVADFNRDNRTDIFWRNPSSGANRMFFMNGLAVTGDSVLPGVTDPAWNVVGAGDFDNNGVNDLVWRNSNTGAMLVWRVNVARRASSPSRAPPPCPRSRTSTGRSRASRTSTATASPISSGATPQPAATPSGS